MVRIPQFGGDPAERTVQARGFEAGQGRTKADRGMPQRDGTGQGRSIAGTRATTVSSDFPALREGQRLWRPSESTEGVKDTYRPDLEAR